MFKANDAQQLVFLGDLLNDMTPREIKFLNESWAVPFAKDIFPAIDEAPFAVLYSDKPSRPNTPVNILVGAHIIKELLDLSDEEVVLGMMMDVRFRVALHTTSLKEQPLSDRSLDRFRSALYDYATTHNGEDLMGDCCRKISLKIAGLMGISGNLLRMDSLMISSNIRTLKRTQLIYECIANLLRHIAKLTNNQIPEDLMHYADRNDYNRTFYHKRPSETDNTLTQLLSDSDRILEFYGEQLKDVEEYKLLVRCLDEQTIVEDGVRRLRTKDDGVMNSSILQSPYDPTATYREKAGKEYRGTVANVIEAVGQNGSIVIDVQVEPNNYSDAQFMEDAVNKMEEQEKPVTIVVDGAYLNGNTAELAEEKNVKVVATDLAGRKPPEILADFKLSEDGKTVISCPCGCAPISCTCQANGQGCATFDRECCACCPHRNECKAKITRKSARVRFSKASHERAKILRFHGTEEFKLYSRIRNGVETIPSLLRRVYNVDHMPRGLHKAKFFVAAKVVALNVRKLLTMLRGSGRYAKNPLIA